MPRCVENQKRLQRLHYERNKEKIKRRAREWTDTRKEKHKRLLNRYKIYVGCKNCGYRKLARALEFHHLSNHEKDKHVALMLHDGVSSKRLKEEVRKCIVLCANCHREIHANEHDVQ